MRLEHVLSEGLGLEDVTAGPAEEVLRRMLRSLGARGNLSRLQVDSCLNELASRQGLRPRHEGPGFAFFQARMLGLLHPALLYGLWKDGALLPGSAARPPRVILLYVGTPVPSPDEGRLLRRLHTALAEEGIAGRLGKARSRLEVREAIRSIDGEPPETTRPPDERGHG